MLSALASLLSNCYMNTDKSKRTKCNITNTDDVKGRRQVKGERDSSIQNRLDEMPVIKANFT